MNKDDFNKLAADHFISKLIGGIVVGSIAFIAGIITAIFFMARGGTQAEVAWLFILIAVIGALVVVVNVLILRSRNKNE
jgi:ABC-type antimicrobial peptide transport system permease subunit